MRISHKNSIQGYVGEWLLRMDVKARAEGKPFLGLTVPQPVQSLMRHELNLCLMLELLEERLTRFERSLNGETKDCDYGAYSEAMCFLDTVYLFSKLLLDSAAGVVRYLHKFGTGCELTKRFNVMYNKSLRGELPDNLNIVFLGVETWFPQLENRRDDIIHHYETYLIGFGRNLEGEKTTVQFSPREKSSLIGDEDLHSYIGMVMAGYQRFVDGLLDYWDEMFLNWYGMRILRHSTTLMGRRANILWWAHEYGGYTNDNMVVSE